MYPILIWKRRSITESNLIMISILMLIMEIWVKLVT